MSNCGSLLVWVGDLDGYINIDAINRANEREAEQERLDLELDEIGDLQLLAGKAISARKLYQQGILPSEWRHALHKAEMVIGYVPDELHQHASVDRQSPESRFVKGMLDLGRSYAIARYARWEHLDYSLALTATLPHGIRALVNQFLAAESITHTRYTDASIRTVLDPNQADGMIAYNRTGLLQAAIHRIADDTRRHSWAARAADDISTHLGGRRLDRERMRVMLSLARLHFSTLELRLMTIDKLRLLLAMYETERAAAGQDETRITTNGRFIRSWRRRHIQPLLNLYPYAIRHGLSRTLAHGEDSFDRAALVNELALAHCGIIRMRRAGRDSTRSK